MGYPVASLVLQLQREISDNPHEAWKDFLEFLWVLLILCASHLDVLGQINHEGELVEGTFIDAANGVINETRTE